MEVWSCSEEEEEEEEERSGVSQGEEEEEEAAEERKMEAAATARRELMQVLCSERVGQVTKTYHDIEAVTHLLEEKERDLELAARIGQSLLKQNRDLTARNELLDEQLEIAKEEIAQLRHELSMRDDLLHLYASTEEIEAASESRLPMPRNESSNSLSNYVHYDFLQHKLKGLEDENHKLRTEANDLTSETTNYEEQEQELMMVCVEELSSVNKRVVDLSEELARKVEDFFRQQEEISFLLAQIVDLQARCKGLTTDNEELTQLLSASRENQSQLRSELRDLQDKYCECEDMLREAREDMKNQRNRSLPNSTVQRYSALAAVFPMDSLAAEIEGTFRKGLDSPAPPEYKNHPRRVFETVKVANQAARLRSRGQSPGGGVPGSGPASARSSHSSTPRTSYYGSDSANLTLEDRPGATQAAAHEDTAHEDTAHEDAAHEDAAHEDAAHEDAAHDDSGVGVPKRLGQPGTPGGHDLEAALHSLSARQQSHASERPFFDVERERKLRALAARKAAEGGGKGEGNGDGEGSSGFLTPNDDSLPSGSSAASTDTNYSNGSSRLSAGSGASGASRSYLPDRLQIVKPLEGSVTLHHWQQLAKPNLDGILHPRPGVLTKDFRELEVDLQHVYSLNDLEEDEEEESPLTAAAARGTVVAPSGPGLPMTPLTHTITTGRTLHPPLLITSFSTSLRPHSLSAYGSSERLSTSPSPSSDHHHHHHQHCGLTFDPGPGDHASAPLLATSSAPPLSLGLLRLLQEQGITASTQPRPYTRCHAPLAPHPPPARGKEEERGGARTWTEDESRTVFSFNLVEKLWGLGLHKLATLGVVGSNGKEKEAVRHPP